MMNYHSINNNNNNNNNTGTGTILLRHRYHYYNLLQKWYLILILLCLHPTMSSTRAIIPLDCTKSARSVRDDSCKGLMNLIARYDNGALGTVETIMLQLEFHWLIKEMDRYKEVRGKWPLRSFEVTSNGAETIISDNNNNNSYGGLRRGSSSSSSSSSGGSSYNNNNNSNSNRKQQRSAKAIQYFKPLQAEIGGAEAIRYTGGGSNNLQNDATPEIPGADDDIRYRPHGFKRRVFSFS